MSKIILVLQTSPRDDGNTQTLTKMFCAGAETAGHHVNYINIGKSNIHGCVACDYCRNNDHTCRLDDDMQDIYPYINTADCIVLAAPLYFSGFPAQLKSVIDRLYAYGPKYLKKESVLLMTAGDQNKKAFDAALATYHMALLEYLDWTNKGEILVPGVHHPRDIQDDPALLKAYKLGFNI